MCRGVRGRVLVSAGELILAPRDPSRAKASDIPDELMLKTVLAYSMGGEFPTDALPQYPAKTVIAKLRKHEQRGWIQRAPKTGWALTSAGHERLAA